MPSSVEGNKIEVKIRSVSVSMESRYKTADQKLIVSDKFGATV